MICSCSNNFFLRVKMDNVKVVSVWWWSNFGFSGPVFGTIGGITGKNMKIINSWIIFLATQMVGESSAKIVNTEDYASKQTADISF